MLSKQFLNSLGFAGRCNSCLIINSPVETLLCNRVSKELVTNHFSYGFYTKREIHFSVFYFSFEPSDQKKNDSVKFNSNNSSDKVVNNSENGETSEKISKVSVWTKIKTELLHYYHGFRLLFLEVKVTLGIMNRLTMGHKLTRRERKQLVRTSADLARMVPFLFFIIVPFAELLLPFYVKFFPFMMPSTFQEESKEKEKTRQVLKGKLEIAKFLQETIAESKKSKESAVGENINLTTFSNFLKQVRESGMTATTADILRFSHLFEDEITLESLNHSQLKALCKLLEINAVGPAALLRFHLKMRVRKLETDDKLIASESIDKIPVWELQYLCRERGMRSMGVSEARLRYQLTQWLVLHLEKKVPITLLLLSRVMYLPDTLTTEEQLKQALLVLPNVVSNEVKLKVADTEDKVDNKTKFEVIKEEQKCIIEERKALKAAKSTVDVSKQVKDTAASATVPAKETETPVTVQQTEVLVDKTLPEEHTQFDNLNKTEITTEDLIQIESAIVNIDESKDALKSGELQSLKQSTEEIACQLNDSASKTLKKESAKDVAAKRLSTKLDKMVKEMDGMVGKLDSSKTQPEKDVEIKSVESAPSVLHGGDVTKSVEEAMESEKETIIDINNLMISLKPLLTTSDEMKWRTILDAFDENQDGKIEKTRVLQAIKLLTAENVKVTNKEVTGVIETISKEEKVKEILKPKKQE